MLNCSWTQVIGIDNLNDYYDVNLKLARSVEHPDFEFIKLDLADREGMSELFKCSSLIT